VSGTTKRGPLSNNRKNRLDPIKVKAKGQLLAKLWPCPKPPTLCLAKGLAREASDGLLVFCLARGLTRKASAEEAILRLARGPARTASDEMSILHLAQGRLSKTAPSPRRTSRTRRHVRLVHSTTPAISAERRLDTAAWPIGRQPHRSHAVQDRTGHGLPTTVLGTVPTTDAHPALCYLTPAPETTRRAESSPGYYSLGISVQNQLLPPRLGSLLRGLSNLGIHACRAPYNGSASAPTGPRLFTQSTHSNQYVARQALRPAITGAPTSHKVRM